MKKEYADFLDTFYVTHREKCHCINIAVSTKGNAVMLHFMTEDGRIFDVCLSINEAHRIFDGMIDAIVIAERNKNLAFKTPEKITVPALIEHIFFNAPISKLNRKTDLT